MTEQTRDPNERDDIKRLSGEQVAEELQAFNAFYAQFGLRFFDRNTASYFRLLSDEARNRAQLQRYADNEKMKD